MTSYFSAQNSQSSAASQRRSSLPRLSMDDTERPHQPAHHVLPSLSHTAAATVPRESPYNHNLFLQQQVFADKSNRLLNLIQNTKGLLEEIRETNATKPWQTYYPSPQIPATSATSASSNPLRRSTSFHPEDDTERSSSLPLQQRIQRSFTSAPGSPQNAHTSIELPSTGRLFELNVLKLDLKVGNYATGNDALLRGLERNTIAHLLDGRIQQSVKHLDNLYQRVGDKSSKVLITGDLNAGKSTLVNALMQRTILPVDQQPCTSLFCEVLDAQENEGQEAVHAIKDPSTYNRQDPNTFTVVDMRHLEKFMNDVIDGYEDYAQLKVYCTDRRMVNDSLLHNGVVDIALIDSPGLNRDSVKTTALFARQQEIDVVVFVVSAENHFTLSGKEFLWNAANEKTHIFIVVNRFDSIRDKERCKRVILDQIKQLSAKTYEDADELVHFVSAGSCLPEIIQGGDLPADFLRLEECLRSFVLEKRCKSKLAPAKVYLENILSDVSVLSESNRQMAAEELAKVRLELERGEPEYQDTLVRREMVLEKVDRLSEETCSLIDAMTREKLSNSVDDIENAVSTLVPWNGLLHLWQYSNDLRYVMADLFVDRVKSCETEAKEKTKACVNDIHNLANESLPVVQSDVVALFTKPDPTRISTGKLKDELALDLTDMFDIQDKLGVASVSLGAVTMFSSKALGYKSLIHSLFDITNTVGVSNVRKWAVPVVTVAGLGILVYIAADIKHALARKTARKLRAHIREGTIVHDEAMRITKDCRRVFKGNAWDIQNRFQREIEAHERRRAEQEKAAKDGEQAVIYFSKVFEKADELARWVAAVEVEVEERKLKA
ncbi:mitofusin [Entomortierella chlamydospora]|uniref:Mitofusin n=1 Tax=Entomortierella chlamydospora TaxID=101097 RepID=A0A9P6MPW5_9FUNG|nr:mitofusin [Entomortierella chlamydospora]KAG0009746.1 mitofusin [Entomortierella chlamydospora]